MRLDKLYGMQRGRARLGPHCSKFFVSSQNTQQAEKGIAEEASSE